MTCCPTLEIFNRPRDFFSKRGKFLWVIVLLHVKFVRKILNTTYLYKSFGETFDKNWNCPAEKYIQWSVEHSGI